MASVLVRTTYLVGFILFAGYAIPLPAAAQNASGLVPLGDGKISPPRKKDLSSPVSADLAVLRGD